MYPNIKDKFELQLARIVSAIEELNITIQSIENNKRFPIENPSEQVRERIKEQNEESRSEEHLRTIENQNKILRRTVNVATAGIAVTALIGLLDLIIRIWFSK